MSKTLEQKIEDAANEIYPPLHPSWSGPENEAWKTGAHYIYPLAKAEGFMEAVEAIGDMNPFIKNHVIKEGTRLGTLKQGYLYKLFKDNETEPNR